MSFNLVRNSRLWFSTNVDTNGKLRTTADNGDGGTASTVDDTYELTVLDGFSFSQTTQQTTIQISEAGSDPIRGQRAFNTALDPVEVTFSTYIRPKISGSDANEVVIAEERFLWNALFGSEAIATPTVVTQSAISYAPTTGRITFSGCPTFENKEGLVVNLYGLASSAGKDDLFNSTAKVITGTTNTAVLEYLVYPSSTAATITASGGVKYSVSSWAEHKKEDNADSVTPYSEATSGTSNKNQLQKFALIFKVDEAIYVVDNCAVDQASIDFALDGIATVAWTLRGTTLRYLPDATITDTITNGKITATAFGRKATGATSAGFAVGAATVRIDQPNFITNKLSTMSLKANIGGGGDAYNIALTGGNITIANNINYITPANLGVVNLPIGYFTGARAISGNVTAYLRTGTNTTAELLSDIVTANAAETKYYLKLDIGGSANKTKVEMLMPGVVLQIPTIETADVISTTINFTAQGHEALPEGTDGVDTDYDIAATNDLRVRYYSA